MVLVDRAISKYVKKEEQADSLQDKIISILELHDGLCMDNREEQEIMAIAIAQVIPKGENHGQEAVQ